MADALVSIVIPAYNAEEFIQRTLTSALQQTYANLEILIIDDGSKDGTRRIADRAAEADPRIRVLSIPNGGVANARNVGTQEAKGEFVAFLDADDLWHPAKIELQVRSLELPVDGRLPAASYTFMRFIDREDNVTHGGRPLAVSGYSLARHLYFKPVGNGSSLLVRRDVVLDLGGYDPRWVSQEIGGCEDLDFELKVAAQHPIVCVPHYLVGYRVYQGNMSSNRVRMATGIVAIVDKHLAQNPHLPSWVVRQARTSTLEYASILLIQGRHWRFAATSLTKLVLAMRHRFVRLAYTAVKNRVQWKFESIVTSEPRSFSDFDQETSSAIDNLPQNEQRLLERLTAVDALHTVAVPARKMVMRQPQKIGAYRAFAR